MLRAGSQRVHRIAAVLVTLSGLYLVYYFWVVDVNEDRSPLTDRIDTLQRRITTGLQDRWQLVAVVLVAIVGGAIAFVATRPTRRTDDP